MPTCSTASGGALVLEPGRSVSLIVWWATLHGLLGWAALAAAVPLAAKAALLIAVATHWRLGRPSAPSPVVCADGVWALPAAGAFGLALGDGTTYSTWWVRLELLGGRRPRHVLVLRDQLSREAWRRLQLAVREAAAADGRDGPDGRVPPLPAKSGDRVTKPARRGLQ